MAAVLPSRRMRRCNPSPLPRASPSGLRCDVIRKLRPARTRSATSWAAVSGVIVMPSVARHRCGWAARSSRLPATPFPRYARDDNVSTFLLFLDVAQQLLDAVGARGRLVILKVELGRRSQPNPLSEKMAD